MKYVDDNTLYGYWNDGTFLYHHGILGMRWGKQNGPPYPRDAEDHSASEKKAGWRKSLKENREIKKQKTRDFLLDMQKNYYKNKPSRNKKTDYILKSIQDYALDFIDEIDNELKNLNNINYNMTSKEENLLKTKRLLSNRKPPRVVEAPTPTR